MKFVEQKPVEVLAFQWDGDILKFLNQLEENWLMIFVQTSPVMLSSLHLVELKYMLDHKKIFSDIFYMQLFDWVIIKDKHIECVLSDEKFKEKYKQIEEK